MLIKVNHVKKSVCHLILKGLHTTPHKSQSHHHMCLREHCMSHVQGWWGFDWVCAIPQGRQTNRNDHQQKMANISKCDASRLLQNICQRNNSINNHSYIFKWLCMSLIRMLFHENECKKGKLFSQINFDMMFFVAYNNQIQMLSMTSDLILRSH